MPVNKAVAAGKNPFLSANHAKATAKRVIAEREKKRQRERKLQKQRKEDERIRAEEAGPDVGRRMLDDLLVKVEARAGEGSFHLEFDLNIAGYIQREELEGFSDSGRYHLTQAARDSLVFLLEQAGYRVEMSSAWRKVSGKLLWA